MLVHENIDLQPHNSFGVSANARYFSTVNSLEELRRAFQFATEKRIPTYVLGEGSNVLFSRDFPGLIIKIALTGVEIDQASGVVRAAAGENWHALVSSCIGESLYGLENLALIPGSVGAAPVQNIGAYGIEIASLIKQVEGLDTRTGERFNLDAEGCCFDYRDSIFKKAQGAHLVISEVTLQLDQDWMPDLSYLSRHEEFTEMSPETPEQLFSLVCRIRRRKLPDPKLVGNAGSFFKNPFVSAECLEELKIRHRDLVSFDTNDPGVKKLPAAWLLEKLGWKGKKHGGAEVSSMHALVLINTASATGEEVSVLADRMMASVFDEFGIALEPEVRIL
ncbi:MAG: UDP-N-acetylmuramate dehydrogenase [Pseudomonadota bacterium]|nr:UDP-N-acetylmuramate dehydrogenase [Pseudomonadota bacterium]